MIPAEIVITIVVIGLLVWLITETAKTARYRRQRNQLLGENKELQGKLDASYVHIDFLSRELEKLKPDLRNARGEGCC